MILPGTSHSDANRSYRAYTNHATGPFPEESADQFLNEARDGGGDSRDRDRCDDYSGENSVGNIVYLPRERFKPGLGGCRATGAIAYFAGPEDKLDGTGTAWNNDHPEGRIEPPDFFKLPWGERARGHLIGRQFGGSGTELRNLVPLYASANLAMGYIENRISKEIGAGQAVHYEVTPAYGTNSTGVPVAVHLEARGNRGMDVDCYIENEEHGPSPVCSSKVYER
ncbi:DNA/RNA non-specific endonuclease [Streptomyces smaragdinus]|uniref:DNA/RNA non-specific endonuclease n=1 Tax=Streptomyces smaragdinus TaxID=2585196 RepID=UPI00389B31CF